MAGTRKIGKFELGRQTAFQSGTRRMEKLDVPAAAAVIVTPVAEMTPANLAAARRSIAPESADAPATEEPSVVVQTVEQMRTRLARRFTTLADEVTEDFVEFRIGAGAWAVELTAPEGMSTAGGKQALQYLRLRPRRQGHAVLVGGVVNAVTKTAELRDYVHIARLYRARFDRELEITSGEWEQFLRKAEVVLKGEGISTSRVSAPHDARLLSHDGQEAMGWQRTAAAIALAVVVFLVTLLGWRVALVLWP